MLLRVMANFSYEVTYGGKSAARNLSGDVAVAIERVRGEMRLGDFQSPQFLMAYKVWHGDEGVVAFGVRKLPSKKADTDRVGMEFSGKEKHILKTKAALLENIPDLELH